MSETTWGAWISIPKDDNEMHLPLTNEVMSKEGIVDKWDFYHHPALKMIHIYHVIRYPGPSHSG